MSQSEKLGRGEATRKSILQAILRIDKGRPKVVSPDRKMSISAVAEEANISRASIHNNYADLASRIEILAGKPLRAQRDQKHTALKDERAKNRALREERDELRAANKAMASQLAMLIDENERLIAENKSKKIVHLKN